MNRLLIISCHAPGHERATQALHATLAAASLDMPATLLWLGEGLQQLHCKAATPFSRMLQQLELFDELALLREATPGMEDTATSLPVKPIAAAELAALINRHHTVMVY